MTPFAMKRSITYWNCVRDELLNGEIFYTPREAPVLLEQWRIHDGRSGRGCRGQRRIGRLRAWEARGGTGIRASGLHHVGRSRLSKRGIRFARTRAARSFVGVAARLIGVVIGRDGDIYGRVVGDADAKGEDSLCIGL